MRQNPMSHDLYAEDILMGAFSEIEPFLLLQDGEPNDI